MKNFERYKTAEERFRAFDRRDCECSACKLSKKCGGFIGECAFRWLELEAEDKELLPCPFCGNQGVYLHKSVNNFWYAECNSCCAKSAQNVSKASAIAAHNRVAKAVMESKKEVE